MSLEEIIWWKLLKPASLSAAVDLLGVLPFRVDRKLREFWTELLGSIEKKKAGVKQR